MTSGFGVVDNDSFGEPRDKVVDPRDNETGNQSCNRGKNWLQQ